MPADEPCEDLAWLLLRNGQRLQAATDRVAREHGLAGGLRDYVVLLLLTREQPRTQALLGQLAGVDKTTLTAVLDRMERDGLIERRLDPNNRRVRIPVATPRGQRLQRTITASRRAAEEVPGMTAAEIRTLRKLLLRLDGACEASGMKFTGSCL